MENLKDRAILILNQNLQKTGELLNVTSYADYFNTINSFLFLDKLDDARKIIDYVTKYQTKRGDFQFKQLILEDSVHNGKIYPIIYLKALTNYFKKSQNKKEISRYIKEIKKALIYLDEHFDRVYILFYKHDRNRLKVFSAYENTLFLSFAGELSDLLNEYNFNKEADMLYMMKTKIELGVMRYFFNNEQKVIIEWFKPEIFKYKIASSKNLIEILLNYDFNCSVLDKEVIKQIKVNLKSEINLDNILFYLFYLKLKEDKEFEKLYKKYEIYIDYFPEKIYDEKDYNIVLKKSLFLNFQENVKRLDKEKKVLVNLEKVKIANLVLRCVIGDGGCEIRERDKR